MDLDTFDTFIEQELAEQEEQAALVEEAGWATYQELVTIVGRKEADRLKTLLNNPDDYFWDGDFWSRGDSAVAKGFDWGDDDYDGRTVL